MTEKNRRGLSTIIATLLIILLTLVSVGIIWVVIRNVVQSGTDQVGLSQKCIAVELSADLVNETSAGLSNLGNYSVTLRRGSDSQGDLGVRVVIFNATNNTGAKEFGTYGDLDPISPLTKTFLLTGVPNGTKVEFTAYFRDSSGNDQLCSLGGEYNF